MVRKKQDTVAVQFRIPRELHGRVMEHTGGSPPASMNWTLVWLVEKGLEALDTERELHDRVAALEAEVKAMKGDDR